jgi:hypothetical protein
MQRFKVDTIDAFNAAQAPGDREICDLIRAAIAANLPEAESKIWHAHPVWFLAGNPIVGYSKLKSCIRLLFWSGQSFTAPGLVPEGTFKAAEKRYTAPEEVDPEEIARWVEEARTVQWDYKNLMKKGRLERLTLP